MRYYVVQPWGRDKYREASIVSMHQTAEEAYDELDVLVEVMSRSLGSGDRFEAYVVDEQLQPVPRLTSLQRSRSHTAASGNEPASQESWTE